MDNPPARIIERRVAINDKTHKNDTQSMLPPSINRQPFEPRKLSTPRRDVSMPISAAPRFRNPSNLNIPMRSASRSDILTPSWRHDVPRGSAKEKNGNTTNDVENIQNLNDEGHDRLERKRPLFGRRDKKTTKAVAENFSEKVEKPKDADVRQPRRVLVRYPKTHKGVSNYENDWPHGIQVCEQAESDIVTESGSPEFHHTEEQPLKTYFDGDGFNESYKFINPEYCSDEIESLASSEPIGDRERTIRGSSPEERKTKNKAPNIPNMIDLEESLKLIPKKGEYRPGAYSTLTHDEWLLAGQKIIDRFKENSERVQKIITARAERMKAYTDIMTEYHEILKRRQTSFKQEREGIQESVRESIAGYCKAHRT